MQTIKGARNSLEDSAHTVQVGRPQNQWVLLMYTMISHSLVHLGSGKEEEDSQSQSSDCVLFCQKVQKHLGHCLKFIEKSSDGVEPLQAFVTVVRQG